MWISKVFNILLFPLKALFIFLVKLYQWIISPLLPKNCRFYPTCSNYMLIAIKEWGVLKGTYLGVKRICRCTPRGKSGEDFVPLNVKGDLKWIY